MAKIVTLFVCILLSLSTQGAIKKSSSSISSLKKQIKRSQQAVAKVKKGIFNIEKNIAAGNVRLKMLGKSLNETDQTIFKLAAQFKKDLHLLKAVRGKTERLFKLSVLELLNNEGSETHLAAKKIILKQLRTKIKDLKQLELTQQKTKDIILDLQQQYKTVKSDRNELLAVLNSMELNKINVVNRYVNASKRTNKYKMRLEKLSTIKKIKRSKKSRKGKSQISKLGMAFQPPLNNFTKLDHGKKGLSYYFKNTSPLYAPQDGKVVYQGRLANYGNVIMIEHGNQIKTIILGDFLAKIKKGNRVAKGDIIGYSKLLNKSEGTIYFEVRKKNVVQNTIFLLDKKYLKDQNLKKI